MDTPGRGGYPCWNVDAVRPPFLAPPTPLSVSETTRLAHRTSKVDESLTVSMSHDGVQIEALAGPEFLPILSLNHGV